MSNERSPDGGGAGGGQKLPMRGSVVDGRYEVVDTVGEGGFGWVFEVKHRLLGQRFAMKILHPSIARDQDWIVRFREEAKATGLAGHESIVFVTDFGACPSFGYYFVMEYLDGENLADYLARHGKASLATLRHFLLTAAGALGSVHELDITHCDLKPGNIMVVERRGRPPLYKFLDFGTSTIVISAASSDVLYGTPGYMAPEQAVGLPLDARADQFSLACIVYEMLTGDMPWYVEGWKDALPEARSSQPPFPVTAFRKDVTERMNSILMRALSVGRHDRWPDVVSFAEAMIEAIDAVQPADAELAYEPEEDPLDVVRETPHKTLFTARSPKHTQFTRSFTAPRVEVPDDLASMVIELPEESEFDLVDDMPLEVSVVYRTADRLRREWRRNFIAGGMFLPSDERPEIDTKVRVNLTYLPGKTSIALDAAVVSHRDDASGNPLGFGIRFDDETSRRLRKFARNLSVGVELHANDVLTRLTELTPDLKLSSGESFVLSRLDEPMQLGRVRALCSGLPFDCDEVVTQLMDRELLALESHEVEESVVQDTAEPTAPQAPVTSPSFSEEEARQVEETVANFVAQRNYMAAMHILQNVLTLAPGRAEFHAALAELALRFAGDSDLARESISSALALAPSDPEILALAEEIYS